MFTNMSILMTRSRETCHYDGDGHYLDYYDGYGSGDDVFDNDWDGPEQNC